MAKIRNGNRDIERVFSGEDSLISCDVPRRCCEIAGHYFRCYLGNHKECSIRKKYIANRETKGL